jgi:hypothetical protein
LTEWLGIGRRYLSHHYLIGQEHGRSIPFSKLLVAVDRV